jgi:hypothetical protein
MKILPNKNYNSVFSFNQLCLPMDVGVLIPKDDFPENLKGIPERTERMCQKAVTLCAIWA